MQRLGRANELRLGIRDKALCGLQERLAAVRGESDSVPNKCFDAVSDDTNAYENLVEFTEDAVQICDLGRCVTACAPDERVDAIAQVSINREEVGEGTFVVPENNPVVAVSGTDMDTVDQGELKGVVGVYSGLLVVDLDSVACRIKAQEYGVRT